MYSMKLHLLYFHSHFCQWFELNSGELTVHGDFFQWTEMILGVQFQLNWQVN